MFRFNTFNRKVASLALVMTVALATLLIPATRTGAADHGDSPNASNDRTADLNDAYLFLDPNDNTRLVMLMTVSGFIVPAEAVNFGIFDPNVRYRFELETNGDPFVDQVIDVTFTRKVGATTNPQVATVSSSFFGTFNAPTTVANLSPTAPAPVITTDAASDIRFFAGVSDDPFFFDIPAFSRFVASVNAGSPDPSVFNRGRDSFAGYNTMSIGLSIPLARIRQILAPNNNILGLNTRTARLAPSTSRNPFRTPTTPVYVNVDRAATPAVNVALIPFGRKDEFNLGLTQDDAAGAFAPDIVATLTRFGTNATNIGILANVAVARGDFLHLDITKANSGPGGGNNAGAGFPNGRRLGDDVIDTILFFVANQNPLKDNVNSNDVPLRDTFPFFAPPQQPRDSGIVDDNTRN
jgi:hypothetical protein